MQNESRFMKRCREVFDGAAKHISEIVGISTIGIIDSMIPVEAMSSLFDVSCVSEMFSLCSAVACCLVAAFSRKSLFSVEKRGCLFFVAAVVLAVALLLLGASPVFAGFPSSVQYIVLAALAFSTAILTILWLALLSHSPMIPVMIVLASTGLLESPLMLLVSILTPHWVVLLLMACVVMSTPFLYWHACTNALSGPRIDSSRDDRSCASWSFPWKPTVLVGFVSFLAAFAQLQGDFSTSWLAVGLGYFIGTCILGVLMLRPSMDFILLQRICALLVVSSALCIPFLHQLPEVFGAILSMSASTVFEPFAEALLCGIVLRYRINPIWLFGLYYAVQSAGFICAEMLHGAVGAFELGGLEIVALSSLLALLATFFFLFFMTSVDIYNAWGMSEILGKDENSSRTACGQGGFDAEEWRKRTYNLSCRYGLTKREEEVCLLLAQGNTVADIEKLLVLSNSTVKTHVAHIYKKLDVHSIDAFKEVFFSD